MLFNPKTQHFNKIKTMTVKTKMINFMLYHFALRKFLPGAGKETGLLTTFKFRKNNVDSVLSYRNKDLFYGLVRNHCGSMGRPRLLL